MIENKPLVSVNHMQAHILAHFIEHEEQEKPKFPFLCLTVSGGHTQIVRVENYNEMKIIGMQDKIVEGETIPVLLEKIEDKNGDVIVSAQKAKKIKGWYELEKAYEENKTITCYHSSTDRRSAG